MGGAGGLVGPFCLIVLLVIEPGLVRVPSVPSPTEPPPCHGEEENWIDFGQPCSVYRPEWLWDISRCVLCSFKGAGVLGWQLQSGGLR